MQEKKDLHQPEVTNPTSDSYSHSVFDEDSQLRCLAVDDLGKRLHRLEMNCEKSGGSAVPTPSDMKITPSVNTQNCSELATPIPSPLETEEWLAFLQQSMDEVMEGDLEAISQKGFIAMVTKTLTSHGASSRVTEYIACLLSLPFVCDAVSQPELAQIQQVSSLSQIFFSTVQFLNSLSVLSY